MKRRMRWAAGASLLLGSSLVWGQDDQPRRPMGPQGRAGRMDPARMLAQFDQNKDGFLDASECPPPLRERFERLDANGDAKLGLEELARAADGLGARRRPADGAPNNTSGGPDALTDGAAEDSVFRLLDADGDGALSKEELENAVRLLKRDTNQNGLLDRSELTAPSSAGRRPGEIITKAAKGERHQDQLQVGDPAPDFTLPDLTGKREVTLSSFRDKKPVVLIFASYT